MSVNDSAVKNGRESIAAIAPIAFALDFPGIDDALEFAAPFATSIAYLKIGLELFVATGPDAVTRARALGADIFLDLKLHDIPQTVESAVARASALGAKLLTVHASGGPKMLERAVSRAEKENAGLRIVAVTVLTSLDDADLASVGFAGSTSQIAQQLAAVAFASGVRHFVCSPHEAADLRARLGQDAILITPGIRAETSENADQKRTATAREAIRAGANVLVVGRPIRDAKDPRSVVEALAREAREANAPRALEETGPK